MGDSILLQTKFLIPYASHNHIVRQSLVNQICSQKSKQCVLLIAPAGYGKTSLLAQVAEQYDAPLIWIQLDDGDNDPATFMAYMIEGLQRQHPELKTIFSEDDHMTPDRQLVVLLNQLLELNSPDWMLVLNDYHVIHNPAVHQLLTTLLDNLPNQLRVVVTSRITPVLPLARWRASNRLLELRAQQLRFSFEEAQTWLSQESLNIADTVIEKLIQKTEGWGAGIQLALALLQENDDQDAIISHLTGTQPYIFDYLMDEVFEHQPDDIQSFLLNTSIFNELNPQTCADILKIESVRDILLTLEKNSLFITRLDTQQQWYRYHQLFRDFLLSKFEAQYPQEYKLTQLAAGQYFAQSGQNEMAIQHFILAGDENNAADMLCSFSNQYFRQGRVDELLTYLNHLSAQTQQTYPRLILLYGRILRHNGQFGAAIERFYHTIESTSDVLVQCQALVEVAAIRHSQGQYQQAYETANEAVAIVKDASDVDYVYALMQLAASAGFVKGMETGRKIAEQAYGVMLEKRDAFTHHDEAKLLHMLGTICWWHGDAHMAIDYCQRALHLLTEMDSPLRARILITLSTPTLYQQDYDRALQLAEQAISICQELHLKETLPAAYAVLGNGLTRVGELEQAESALQTAIQQADAIGGARYSRVMAAGYLAQNLALQGRVSEAQYLVEQSLMPYEDQPVVYDVYVCRSVLADLLLDSDKLDEAHKIYSQLITLGETTQYRIPLAMAYFGLAYILMQEEQREKAIQYSQQSLNFLEPTMMPQLYLDQQERALVITKALVQHEPTNAFAQQIYQMLSKTVMEPEQPTITLSRPDRIEILTIGGFNIYRDGQEIESAAFASASARDLLAYFVTMREKSINLERAIEAIWTDGTGSTSGFHTALYRVRVALRRKGEKEKFILSEMGDYRLDRTKFDIDIDRFYTLLKRIRQGDQKQAPALYERALELYQGDYLDNLYYEWVIIERERLQREYLSAIKSYSDILIADAQYHLAEKWLQRALTLEPYDEHLHIVYMRTLAQMGQQQSIIAHYQRLKELLNEAFNTAPMQETQAVYQTLIS